jgi:hypothetical protein
MESGKPSNQSARGVDIPPTTRNLVFHTHRCARVRSCSRATDVCPAHWCAYGPTVACGGPDPRVGMKGKWLLWNDLWMFQACELGLPLQGLVIRFRIVHFSWRLRLLIPSAT